MNKDKQLNDIVVGLICNPHYAFYGFYLAELNKSFANIPTACVGKHPSSPQISLMIGEEFWEKDCPTRSNKEAILVHELEHVVREHLSTYSSGMFPDKLISNIAMDVSINQGIKLDIPHVNHKGERIGVFIEDFPELKLAKDESSLYYYHKFMEAKENKSKSKGAADSKSPNQKPGNKRGTSGNSYLDQFLDQEEDGNGVDWHDKWGDLTKGMSDEEREIFSREIQEAVRRVAEETEKSRGIVPVHITNSIKDNFGRKPQIISWKLLFRRFVGSTMSTDVRQTRKRPNFRYEDAPVTKPKSKIRIVVGCDSSGSVSDKELEEFFGQIKHMYEAGTHIDVCMWDTNVHLEYVYKGEMKFERVCQGGTMASSFIDHVNENRRKWTCAICMTDGYIESEPSACKIPMLWVITPGGSTSFKSKSTRIKMN